MAYDYDVFDSNKLSRGLAWLKQNCFLWTDLIIIL